MPEDDQKELSRLLACSRADQLDDTECTRPNALMQIYMRGPVLKAQAWTVVVARSLQISLA
jgi:hypothetical protein